MRRFDKMSASKLRDFPQGCQDSRPTFTDRTGEEREQTKEQTDPTTELLPNRTVCCVPGCNERYNTGISFHAFPRKNEKERYRIWTKKLRLKYEPTNTTRVCSHHFSVQNFIPPCKYKSIFLNEAILIENPFCSH